MTILELPAQHRSNPPQTSPPPQQITKNPKVSNSNAPLHITSSVSSSTQYLSPPTTPPPLMGNVTSQFAMILSPEKDQLEQQRSPDWDGLSLSQEEAVTDMLDNDSPRAAKEFLLFRQRHKDSASRVVSCSSYSTDVAAIDNTSMLSQASVGLLEQIIHDRHNNFLPYEERTQQNAEAKILREMITQVQSLDTTSQRNIERALGEFRNFVGGDSPNASSLVQYFDPAISEKTDVVYGHEFILPKAEWQEYRDAASDASVSALISIMLENHLDAAAEMKLALSYIGETKKTEKGRLEEHKVGGGAPLFTGLLELLGTPTHSGVLSAAIGSSHVERMRSRKQLEALWCSMRCAGAGNGVSANIVKGGFWSGRGHLRERLQRIERKYSTGSGDEREWRQEVSLEQTMDAEAILYGALYGLQTVKEVLFRIRSNGGGSTARRQRANLEALQAGRELPFPDSGLPGDGGATKSRKKGRWGYESSSEEEEELEEEEEMKEVKVKHDDGSHRWRKCLHCLCVFKRKLNKSKNEIQHYCAVFGVLRSKERQGASQPAISPVGIKPNRCHRNCSSSHSQCMIPVNRPPNGKCTCPRHSSKLSTREYIKQLK